MAMVCDIEITLHNSIFAHFVCTTLMALSDKYICVCADITGKFDMKRGGGLGDKFKNKIYLAEYNFLEFFIYNLKQGNFKKKKI